MTTNPGSPAFDPESRQLVCELCFEWVSFDDLYVDAEGQVWDICKACGIAEQQALRCRAGECPSNCCGT